MNHFLTTLLLIGAVTIARAEVIPFEKCNESGKYNSLIDVMRKGGEIDHRKLG